MRLRQYKDLDLRRVKAAFAKVRATIEAGDFYGPDVKKRQTGGYFRAKLDHSNRLLLQFARCGETVCLHALGQRNVELGKAPRAGSKMRREFDARQTSANCAGVDLTRINGLGLAAVMKILSEIGPDLSRFDTVKHFCSWLGLCPGTKISGGKVLSAKTKRSANRAPGAEDGGHTASFGYASVTRFTRAVFTLGTAPASRNVACIGCRRGGTG